MWAIIQKEFNVFFTSFIGIGLMFSFYLLIGLYTWFFQGNILDFGFAELSVFFDLSPWFFLFFTPAICMRLFSEEFELGTFNLLRTLPISIERIIWAKVLSQILLMAIILVPTLLFIFSMGSLSSPAFNVDFGIVFSAYLSLLLLIFVFVCLSAFASSMSIKQSLSFVLGVFFNFVFWQGPQEISKIFNFDMTFQSLNYHFQNMSRGVLDFSSIGFYLGLSSIIVGLTILRFQWVYLKSRI
jgi:ABC-2 type transport system permease protein